MKAPRYATSRPDGPDGAREGGRDARTDGRSPSVEDAAVGLPCWSRKSQPGGAKDHGCACCVLRVSWHYALSLQGALSNNVGHVDAPYAA